VLKGERALKVTLRGQIERITYHNPENGYTIACLRVEGAVGAEREPTIVGAIPSLAVGENVEVQGSWGNHPKYGRQFSVESCRQVPPATPEGIQRYLGSGLIKGIGPISAKRIVEQFGTATLEVIEKDPQRLRQVPGLGRKKADLIVLAWAEERDVRDAMIFLQGHGIGQALAVKLVKKYAGRTVQTVQEHPFQLEQEVRGIGFVTADRIAASVGIAKEAPQRLEAGIRYLLDQSSGDGHVFLPAADLIDGAGQLLGVDPQLLSPALEALTRREELVLEESRYFLPWLYRSEVGIAQSIQRILRTPARPLSSDRLASPGIALLSDEQRTAVAAVMDQQVLVLTGGPGTGKTTVTREIVHQFEQSERKVSLCSPTGRAAKRLAEASGREAKTIHRLLEFQPAEGRFRKQRRNPLDTDVVIVDEASMIDVSLMNALLNAIPSKARLILVGDADQLPSVGPGNVMRDIIESDAVPVARLQEIHRQGPDSQIALSAHRIINGQWPLVENQPEGDFFVVEEEDPVAIAQLVEDLCARRLPEKRGYDPIRDIQVLTPMYRGETGALSLNKRLQERLTPRTGNTIAHGDQELRVGDKVLQVRNNYDKGVFNGDLGRVTSVDAENELLEVDFDGGIRCQYDRAQIDELILAYAMSIHRSQGSEFPVVILPLSTQHYVMLQRNLLYTAVTRAKVLLVLVGSRRAISRAIDNDDVSDRFTALKDRIRG
jgi:exodeoxyribonuclease V alpha subunit